MRRFSEKELKFWGDKETIYGSWSFTVLRLNQQFNRQKLLAKFDIKTTESNQAKPPQTLHSRTHRLTSSKKQSISSKFQFPYNSKLTKRSTSYNTKKKKKKNSNQTSQNEKKKKEKKETNFKQLLKLKPVVKSKRNQVKRKEKEKKKGYAPQTRELQQ